jgi:hypothetical protein
MFMVLPAKFGVADAAAEPDAAVDAVGLDVEARGAAHAATTDSASSGAKDR